MRQEQLRHTHARAELCLSGPMRRTTSLYGVVINNFLDDWSRCDSCWTVTQLSSHCEWHFPKIDCACFAVNDNNGWLRSDWIIVISRSAAISRLGLKVITMTRSNDARRPGLSQATRNNIFRSLSADVLIQFSRPKKKERFQLTLSLLLFSFDILTPFCCWSIFSGCFSAFLVKISSLVAQL